MSLEQLSRFLSDPFNRREFTKHDKILEEMEQTKERVEHTRRTVGFPIAASVGNPRLRRREQYANR